MHFSPVNPATDISLTARQWKKVSSWLNVAPSNMGMIDIEKYVHVFCNFMTGFFQSCKHKHSISFHTCVCDGDYGANVWLKFYNDTCYSSCFFTNTICRYRISFNALMPYFQWVSTNFLIFYFVFWRHQYAFHLFWINCWKASFRS